MTKKTLLILAAGMGSRYGGDKQIDLFGPNDEMLMEYSIYDALRAGFNKIVFVIREEFSIPFKKQMDAILADKAELVYINQSIDKFCPNLEWRKERIKPWGTGHAILCCSDVINEPFIMINADDFYGVESFQLASNFLSEQCSENLYGMVSYQLSQVVSRYGFVSRGICFFNEQGKLSHIEENKNIVVREGKIISIIGDKEIELAPDTHTSMNLFCFHQNIFPKLAASFDRFLVKHHKDLKEEFLIPNYIGHRVQKDGLGVHVENTTEKWFGVTYQDDADIVRVELKRLVAENIYPNHLWQ